MGCSLHDNRLHCSVAIFFCPVLQFRGFDVPSERSLLAVDSNTLWPSLTVMSSLFPQPSLFPLKFHKLMSVV